MTRGALKEFLEEKVSEFNRPAFIADDPISVPHAFSKRQDIEISGFFAAVLAWGQRKTIIRKCGALMQRMDHAPHDFILHHSEQELSRFEDFCHRTFNGTDTLYFIEALRMLYRRHASLEEVFAPREDEDDTGAGLIRFHELFFSLDAHPHRTRKHLPTPERKSTCKRLNMYLRWMVRQDDNGVDFGIWKKIPASKLVCPCDVHVDRVARKLRLIKRKQTDWLTAIELTRNLRKMDPLDPVKYDFALFGLGVEGRY